MFKRQSIFQIGLLILMGFLIFPAVVSAQEGEEGDDAVPTVAPIQELLATPIPSENRLLRTEDNPSQMFPGDAVLIGYNSGINAQFSFLILSNIGKGTRIYLTDNGWSTETGLKNEEGTYRWVAPRDMCAGSVITVEDSDIEAQYPTDQLFLYHPSPEAEGLYSFLHAISINPVDEGWQPDASSEARSQLPIGLQVGETAMTIRHPFGVYVGPTTGSREEIRTRVSDPINWFVSDNEPQIMPTNSFSITDAPSCEICNIAFGQSYSFVGGLDVTVDAVGKFIPLQCIEVTYIPEMHAYQPDDIDYLTTDPGIWRIETTPPNATGFQVTMTANLDENTTSGTHICRLVGGAFPEWNCEVSGFINRQVTLDGVTSFGEFVIGNYSLNIYERPGEEWGPLDFVYNLSILYPGIAATGIAGLFFLFFGVYLGTKFYFTEIRK